MYLQVRHDTYLCSYVCRAGADEYKNAGKECHELNNIILNNIHIWLYFMCVPWLMSCVCVCGAGADEYKDAGKVIVHRKCF